MLKKTVFLTTVSKIFLIPENVVEIIISGRSNVGKSSVINTLCSKKNLARISKIPGRTMNINIYNISAKKWIVDLPGYGFAKVSLRCKVLWKVMIEEYITKRNSEKTIYVVIDAFIGPTKLDFDMVKWINANNISFKIIANKYDKIYKNVTEDEIQNRVAKYFNISKQNVFVVSAKFKKGFEKVKLDIIKFLTD
jgi:GTP-binding protein